MVMWVIMYALRWLTTRHMMPKCAPSGEIKPDVLVIALKIGDYRRGG
jgi:hypothetical protein